MAAPWLAEGTVVLIQNFIKANIVNALTSVRTQRNDAQVNLTEPLTYFIYETAKGYKTPAIFVICEDFDFRLSENQANHINGTARVNVTVVVEDREKSQLTYKCWRFQSALHELLAQTALTSTDNRLKLTVAVKRASFSPVYSSAAERGTAAVFRKEVMLELDVFHRENY